MNYRHSYHAGNFADVFKHTVLLSLIDYLRKKPKPFAVLDTHAGSGLYDLASPESQKTLEYQRGISRLNSQFLLPSHAVLKEYLNIIASFNPAEGIRFYPGSPLFIQRALRPQDSLTVCELHPETYEQLKFNTRNLTPPIAVHHRDAYESLKAFLPLNPRRGLILIDPPFENPHEFQALKQQLRLAVERFSQGIFAIWYPIKDQAEVDRFCRSVMAGDYETCRIECTRREAAPLTGHLNACGMLIINPPWQFLQTLRSTVLPPLAKALDLNFTSQAKNLQ